MRNGNHFSCYSALPIKLFLLIIILSLISSVFLQLADADFLFQRENIWGPFLIISPASTLNNWHQEFTRFVPKFKVKINNNSLFKINVLTPFLLPSLIAHNSF